MPRQHFKFSLILHPRNRHDIPLAHYFPSKHTDTSCSASKWPDQRSFKVNRQSKRLPFLLCPSGVSLPAARSRSVWQVMNTLLLLQGEAWNARENKKSWQISFLQHLLRCDRGLVCVSLTFTTSRQTGDWPLTTSWHSGQCRAVWLIVTNFWFRLPTITKTR